MHHWRLSGTLASAQGTVRWQRYGQGPPVVLCHCTPWSSYVPFFRLVRDEHEVFERLPAHLHEALVRRYIADASHRGLREEVLDALTGPWLGPAGQPAFYRQIAQADQQDTDEIEGRYGELDLPVRIVWGVEDTWLPVDRAHRLHALIPGSSLRFVERAGHLVQEDTPAELAVDLAGWLAAPG